MLMETRQCALWTFKLGKNTMTTDNIEEIVERNPELQKELKKFDNSASLEVSLPFLMQKYDITDATLADDTWLSRSLISLIKDDKRKITVETGIIISNYFKVNAFDFLFKQLEREIIIKSFALKEKLQSLKTIAL